MIIIARAAAFAKEPAAARARGGGKEWERDLNLLKVSREFLVDRILMGEHINTRAL